MRFASDWQDYRVIDTSNGEKLEYWGDTLLIRPDPQVLWNTERKNPLWNKAAARYIRSNKGGGNWEYYTRIKDSWLISYHDLVFQIKPTGFKHTGLFPEQSVNWNYFRQKIQKANRPIKVLNLFAYTGGATLACAAAGAQVCHVDSSKGMVSWARENARLSGLTNAPIRWIVDDCKKFVEREIRRQNRYDAIIMDPPSYGRGPNGEIWKLEEQIYELVTICSQVLSDNPLFFAINSYTTGISMSVMGYLLGVIVNKQYQGHISTDEVGLPVEESGYILPCGSTALWESME